MASLTSSAVNKQSVDTQLADYRARKREYVEVIRTKTWTEKSLNFVSKFIRSNETISSTEKELVETELFNKKLKSDYLLPQIKFQNVTQSSFGWQKYVSYGKTILALKLLLWVIAFKLFIIFEFGAVFFLVSCFAVMWMNMRSGTKSEEEISAYSVFNPGCQNIQGAFTAEQFEKQLLHKT